MKTYEGKSKEKNIRKATKETPNEIREEKERWNFARSNGKQKEDE